MPQPVDKKYYALRAEQQLELGEQAASASVAAVHYEMALRYAILASDLPRGKAEIEPLSGGAGTLLPDAERAASVQLHTSHIVRPECENRSLGRASRATVQ